MVNVKSTFGLGLPLSAGLSAWDYNLNFERMREVVMACEDLGFDSVWAPDHIMLGRDSEVLEAWTVLSALSQATETMHLGTLVTCPTHRHPAMLAKIAATLDVVSNGRLELGIGAGWNGAEQLAYGLPWEEVPKARVERLIETVEIVRGLWTNERFTFKGRHYSVTDAVCLPKPVQKPSPKIHIGGRGEQLVLRAVAMYADGWNIDEVSPEDYAHKLDVIREHCRSVGRPYREIEKSLETYLMITDRPEQEERIVEWMNWQTNSNPERIRQGKPPVKLTLEQVKREIIFGSIEEVTERLGQYIDVGVEKFIVYFMDYPSLNSILPFAEQVVPSLA
jgi:F420-dependent oxidoreductase-like protein